MLKLDRMDDRVRHAPDTGGSTGAAGDGQGGPPSGEPSAVPEWDAFIGALPAETRALYERHEAGLRATVQATRAERDALRGAGQERDALKGRVDAMVKALDGKDPETVRQQLSEIRADLETASKRAAFYEDAGKPEIGCRNPRLAFMVAQSEALFDRRGAPDWQAIRTAAPELFGPVVPQGNAGAGTGRQPDAKTSINDYIRQAAGRR